MKKKSLFTLVGSICLALVLAALLLPGCAKPAPAPAPAPTPKPEPAKMVWIGETYAVLTPFPYGPFKGDELGAFAPIRRWSQWLTDATDGRLVIEWHDPGSIFPIAESDKAIAKGVADIASSVGMYYSGRIPEANVEVGLPFASLDVQADFECWYKYGLNEVIKEVYAEQNIYHLMVTQDSMFSVGATFAMPNPEALKGKKIRAYSVYADYLAALGAVPTPVPWTEIYMGMKLGTIDGYTSSPGSMEDIKLKEVTSNFLASPPMSTASTNILINMDSFRALPKDIQELIDRDSKDILFCSGYLWHQQNLWVLKHAEAEYGVKLERWSDEDIARVTQLCVDKVYPEVAALSARTARAVEIVMTQMRDYGRIK